MNRMKCFSILLAAGLVPAAAHAQEDPDEEMTFEAEEEAPDQAPAPAPPEAVPPPEAVAAASASPTAGYKKGFFIHSEDGKFSTALGLRIQARYQHELVKEGEDTGNFSIPRARLSLGGHAFDPDVKYKFQADFGKGFVSLKDFYVDWKVGGDAIVRAGQFKRPFSRQQVNSSSRLELVDRAITDKAFGAGRDLGVMVHNNYEKSPDFEWALGVFNGTGDKPVFSGEAVVDPMTGEGTVSGGFSNVPDKPHPAVVLRAGINHGGVKGYSEGDLEGGPLRFAVGASVRADFDADGGSDSFVMGELDYVVKAEGFNTTGAVYIAMAQDGEGFGDQSLTAIGAHLQAGYMVGASAQPVVRYALVAPDGPGNNLQEITGGFSYYFHAHGLKWQTDVGALLPEGGDADILARTQLQLSF